ncbi:MAG TPA: efflux RND transporter permease subunit [Candidatus Hydrogenedentes bacterium]|nr:efflux RND transporter permease subunit [Candidatus Hydrogenedentota bacterium]HRT18979.1 efflux RND transporter permease subunit [Candidatus Hydrogenedentota bacterium]HRT65665.1 efflux RND transporter permease subunit [Candidatus Hydrogenedentota bacterium]
MKTQGLAGKIAHVFIDSKLTPLMIAASLLLGLGAVVLLPREEEPQIVVPMIDIFVQMPGAGAKEIEERVTKPMEKLLWEIPGVEYIYSTSSPGAAFAVVRFYVGENEEDAIVRLNQKMFSNFDIIPPGCSQPLIKPRSIDDVPILALTLSSERYDHFTLRRVAAQLHDAIKEVANVSEVKLIGGQRRQVRVVLDPARMAAYGVAPATIIPMLSRANAQNAAGSFSAGNREFLVEAGGFLKNADEVGAVVIGVFDKRPIYLRDVSEILDGPEEAANYVFNIEGPASAHSHVLGRPEKGAESSGPAPAVTISVAKRKGSNAITIADHVIEKVRALQGTVIPSDIQVTVSRNYGETAQEKSNELLYHMFLAVVSVAILIAFVLGVRESGTVAIAIPVTLALTLVVFYFYGYTLNRVTLFALIFSIGILVDDAIVVVENIVRHYHLPENKGRPVIEIAVDAVDEVGNPTLLATAAVIAAILPMAFVRGLMGPYMAPIPVGASAAMIFSVIVSFMVTPWAAYRLLRAETPHKHKQSWFRRMRRTTGTPSLPPESDIAMRTAGTPSHAHSEGALDRLYRRVMDPLIHRPILRYGFLVMVSLLLLAACSLVPLSKVLVKMLPFDNKSEFQVIIDMPEGTTLEQTATATRAIADYLRTVPEVANMQTYVGTASPHNFNGLVRHYFLRSNPNEADIQVNLAPKEARAAQSHDIAKRVRPGIQAVAERFGARVKVAEVPPGPPVLQTLVAEVYGPTYERQIEVARKVREIFEQTEGVVDTDWYVEDDQTKIHFDIDQEKAALNGISVEQAGLTLRTALEGTGVGLIHQPKEKEDVAIMLRLDRAHRSSVEDLKAIKVAGDKGNLVSLGEIVKITETIQDKSIYHKNLMPVVYVTGDVGGVAESPVYVIFALMKRVAALVIPEGYPVEQYSTMQPFSSEKIAIKWDGEWFVTYEVFRDMGLAFAAVLVLIFILVVGWFQSLKTPFVIMAAIPFSLVGILPAHWLMGAFFTATSMIGFIAGAGIVVRNSIILVDFIELRLKEGMPLADAVVDAGAVRFRPMLLTAAAVIVGSSVILFDPIFQGLAISLMAGEIASLLLSRMAVPILYYLSRRHEVA